MQNLNMHGTGEKLQLVDVVVECVRQQKLIVTTTVLISALSVGVAVVMSPVYTAKATIMPPQQQSSSVSALLGQLGGLAGAAGSIAGLKNPNDLYVGMLESRTVTDDLIKRFKLEDRYHQDTMLDTRKVFEKKRRVAATKDGMISVEVDDKDPQVAADIANRFVDELVVLTQTFAITEASKRRIFFEKQLQNAKEQLAKAEVDLRNTQESTGMLQLNGQVQTIISSIAQIRGMIAAKEVTLASLGTFATDKNPEVQRLQEEIRALRGQLENLEKGQQNKEALDVPAGKLPEVGVEYVRRLRDVKYYETLFEMLAKQFELAKIDEARDASTIQQLDKAVPADKEASPRRKLVAVAGSFLGLVVGILLALVRGGKILPPGSDVRARWDELRNRLSAMRATTTA